MQYNRVNSWQKYIIYYVYFFLIFRTFKIESECTDTIFVLTMLKQFTLSKILTFYFEK